MVVTIRNFRAFNSRTDIKHPGWFRMSNALFEDPDFYAFAPSELLAWIYILCQASKKNSDSVRVSIAHLERVGRIKERDFLSAVQKLEELRIIAVDVTDELRARDVDVTHTLRERDATDRQTDRQTPPIGKPTREEFESAYQEYPRKEGKSAGLKICERDIQTHEDLFLLKQAIAAYAGKLRREKTDKKYTKHFDSFMRAWRDHLESDAPPAAKLSPFQADLARELAEKPGGAA